VVESAAFTLGQGSEEPKSKIDYSVGLCLSQESKDHLENCTNAVNPTLYHCVRWAPTTVHIETKATGENWHEAQYQLSLWLIRHIAKLRELLTLAGQSDDTPIPAIPVLIVQGHNWECLFFEDQFNKARLLAGETYTVGSTRSVVGVYAVIAALHYLMDWSQNEYRPWFERMILKPLLAKPQL
jgi:hypothetical protein